jgi:hypothetical protein
LVDHQEYAGRLRLYEETADLQGGWRQPQMHCPAVASIAVGKTTGVAPEPDLYYIASAMCYTDESNPVDFGCLAKSVRRALDINRQLPAEQKIHVLSMSIGWTPSSKGYDEIVAATRDAKEAGLLVACSGTEFVHGFRFLGLGRSPLADPNSFERYEPGLFWAKEFYAGRIHSGQLFVPMGSRTTASPSGVDDYVFYREGGHSWAVPYVAGIYALAVQAKRTVTPDEFWAVAMKTGRTIKLAHERREFDFGPILDPVALIGSLRAGQ